MESKTSPNSKNGKCIFIVKGVNGAKDWIYEFDDNALTKLNREHLLGRTSTDIRSSSQKLAFSPYKLSLSGLLNDCTLTESIKRLDGNFHLDLQVIFILGAMIAPYGLETDTFSAVNTQHLTSLWDKATIKHKEINMNAKMRVWDEKKISESIGSYLESAFFLYHHPHATTSYDGRADHTAEECKVGGCKDRLIKIKPSVYLDVLERNKEQVAGLFDGSAVARLLFGKPRDVFVFSYLSLQLYRLIFAYCYSPIAPSRCGFIFESNPALERLIRNTIRQILSVKDVNIYEPYLNRSFKIVDCIRDHFVRFNVQTLDEAIAFCRQIANNIRGAFV